MLGLCKVPCWVGEVGLGVCHWAKVVKYLLKIDGSTYIVVGSFWYTFIIFQILKGLCHGSPVHFV